MSDLTEHQVEKMLNMDEIVVPDPQDYIPAAVPSEFILNMLLEMHCSSFTVYKNKEAAYFFIWPTCCNGEVCLIAKKIDGVYKIVEYFSPAMLKASDNKYTSMVRNAGYTLSAQ